MRHPFVADRKDSLLLIIDIQQAMLKVIDVWEENVRRAKQLINSANILGVPVLVVLDLIAHGYQVHVVKNAVASRYREDWEAAIEIFRDAGAVISTAEIVIFQWICRSNTEDFRKVLPIVK